jgi:hypothetical protein
LLSHLVSRVPFAELRCTHVFDLDSAQEPEFLYPLGFNNKKREYKLDLSGEARDDVGNVRQSVFVFSHLCFLRLTGAYLSADCKRCLEEYACFPSEIIGDDDGRGDGYN